MKRILYFTGYRMVAQQWNRKKLETSIYFEPDEQGLDMFESYLDSFRNESVSLLVDLIEEEFKQVEIPFLRGSDRKAVIDRNFAKFFRQSTYRHAISQGIEKKGRKQEKLLFIGLTNQYLLEPWLKVINRTKTPLKGIVSLPMLSEQFLPKIEAAADVVILVTQQVPSNLRQSVYIKGKLILSRLVPIASFYHGDYAGDVIRDIESTQRYLISQRIIDRTALVSVQIVTNRRHFDRLSVLCAQDDNFNFDIHNINDVIEKEELVIEGDQDFSSVYFCYLASKQRSLNHYANKSELKYLRHHYANATLKVASVVLVAIAVGLFLSSLVKNYLYQSTITEAGLIEQKYESKFKVLNASKIDSKTSTKDMQYIVKTVEKLQNNYLNDPQQMFAMISRDTSIFSDVRITGLEWFVAKDDLSEKVSDVTWGKVKKRGRLSKEERKKQRAAKIRNKNFKGYYEIAYVYGQFLNFDGNYRYALSAVSDLEQTMRESGNYHSVEIRKRPLDIESENELIGDVSAKKVALRHEALFEMRLVRKVEINAN